MSPAEAFRVIIRHWVIIALGLILTGAGTAYGYVAIPNSYSSTSVVMLLQRPTSSKAGGENPYLTMDASLTVTAAAVQRAVSDSPTMAAALTATDSAGTFVVTPVMSGPFLQIDTGATSPTRALAVQQLVRDQMQLTLKSLQSSVGAPSNLQIQLNEVTQPTKPVPVLKRKLQFVGGILFGGLALTVSVAFLVDRVRNRGDATAEATPDQDSQGQDLDAQGDQPVPDSMPASLVTAPQQPEPNPQLRLRGPIRPRMYQPDGPDRQPGLEGLEGLAGRSVATGLRPALLGAAARPQPISGSIKTRNGMNGFPTAPATFGRSRAEQEQN